MVDFKPWYTILNTASKTQTMMNVFFLNIQNCIIF